IPLRANIDETPCVTAISEQGGKETSMATINGTARPASQQAAISDTAGDDLPRGGREAPRPDPEVLARPKRRTYTVEYKQQVLAEAEAARGSGEIGAVLR